MTVRRLVFATIIVGLVIAGLALWSNDVGPEREVPHPADLSVMEPDVALFIQQKINLVNDSPQRFQAWLDLGMAYSAAGLLDLAIPAIETSVDLQPDVPQSWYHLALVREQRGDLPRAVEALERAIQLEEDYGPSHIRHGLWMLDRGKSDRAEESFRRALEIDASSTMARLGLARVKIEQGDGESAATILEQYLSDGSAPNRGYANLLLSRALRMEDRTEQAELALRQSVVSPPTWSDPWQAQLDQFRRDSLFRTSQARRLMRQGEFTAAISMLEQVRRSGRVDPALVGNLAQLHVMAGQPDAAVDILEQALVKHPLSAMLHLNLASAYQARGDLTLAQKHVEISLARNPHSAEAHFLHGVILERNGRNTDAARAYVRAIEIDPSSASVHWALGKLQLGMRQWVDAATTLTALIEQTPLDGNVWLALGIATLECGDFDRADHCVAQAQMHGVKDQWRLKAVQEEIPRRRSSLSEPTPTQPLEGPGE
jgi:tetratricopeptide (TPR) repeat protein